VWQDLTRETFWHETDFDRCPANMDSEGRIVWQADASVFGDWRRLPKHGVSLFRTRELSGDAFAANYGPSLLIYGAC
jgi:hypothetical protein